MCAWNKFDLSSFIGNRRTHNRLYNRPRGTLTLGNHPDSRRMLTLDFKSLQRHNICERTRVVPVFCVYNDENIRYNVQRGHARLTPKDPGYPTSLVQRPRTQFMKAKRCECRGKLRWEVCAGRCAEGIARSVFWIRLGADPWADWPINGCEGQTKPSRPKPSQQYVWRSRSLDLCKACQRPKQTLDPRSI